MDIDVWCAKRDIKDILELDAKGVYNNCDTCSELTDAIKEFDKDAAENYATTFDEINKECANNLIAALNTHKDHVNEVVKGAIDEFLVGEEQADEFLSDVFCEWYTSFPEQDEFREWMFELWDGSLFSLKNIVVSVAKSILND